MRTASLSVILVLLAAGLFFTSCQKQEILNPHQPVIAKINAWLANQRSSTDENRNTAIQSVTDKLDYSGLRFEELNEGERFLIVPLKKAPETITVSSKEAACVLLLIENKAGNIRRGTIVQYIPDQPKAIPVISVNSFFRIFNAELPDEDAQFSFFSVTGRLLYKATYKDDRMQSTGVAKPSSTTLNSPPQDPIGPQPICTDWYLVTTYYYADGSTEQTEQYLYTVCEPNSGGGGEGNDIEYEFEAGSEENWTVYPGPIGTWGVYALDKLKGKRKSGENEGGHFTGITNISADCIRCSSYSVIWNWNYRKTEFSGQRAWSHIKGHLSWPNHPDEFVDKVHEYKFKDIF